jgi:hypothetical protein
LGKKSSSRFLTAKAESDLRTVAVKGAKARMIRADLGKAFFPEIQNNIAKSTFIQERTALVLSETEASAILSDLNARA